MLARTLIEVRKRIAKQAKGLNENNTKATLIEPVLRALGWDVEDTEDVDREYKLKPRDKPVDYALLVLREAKLFVEAKGLGENLDDRRWSNQIMGYASVAGIEWIVLTDGNEYRIYNSHASVPIEQKLLMTVKLSDNTSVAEQMLGMLAKDEIQTKRIDALWRANFVDRKVLAALEKLFEPDGMVLVNHIRNSAKDLTPEEVRGSLRRCKAKFEYPLEPEVTVPRRAQPAGRKAPKDGDASPNPKPTSNAGQLTFLDLIRAGLIKPPLKLTKTYLGTQLIARVLTDGSIEFGGKGYNSPSQAGSVARASVSGLREDGRLKATNGWTFWSYKTADGREVEIDALRMEYMARFAAKSGQSAAGA